jgi:hypothetical protein
MAKTRASKIVQLKARMREPLRARLEATAEKRGVSLNAELVDRLERSFAKDDAFGGLTIANMARLMASAFLQAGQHAAHAKYPHWRPAQWIHNSDCYDAAAKAVVRVLKSMRPINLPPPGPTTLHDLREHYGLIELGGDDHDLMHEDSKTEPHPAVQEPKEEPSDEK